MSSVVSLRAYFGAGVNDFKDTSLRQFFSQNEIRALDDLIFPHYERGLISNWQYGKGRGNSYLSAVDDQIGDRNQIFCLTKELPKDDFAKYILNVPRLEIIAETVNFDEVRRILKGSLPDVPHIPDVKAAPRSFGLFKS